MEVYEERESRRRRAEVERTKRRQKQKGERKRKKVQEWSGRWNDGRERPRWLARFVREEGEAW